MAVVVMVVMVRWRRAAGGGKQGGAAGPCQEPPINIIQVTRPVEISRFADHFRHMSADSDYRISEEFEALKQVGKTYSCSTAELPVNRPKNRFTNILPYDHSR